MKIYRLRPDQDSFELHNLGRSGVRLYHDQMYTEHALRSELGYRDDYQLQWFDMIGESPPECDASLTFAALVKGAEALRQWILTSPVIQKFGWSQAKRAGSLSASQPATVRELVVQRIEQLVDAAVRLGRSERPEVEELDESGAPVVLNRLVEWATPSKDLPVDNGKQSNQKGKAPGVSLDSRAVALFLEQPGLTKKEMAKKLSCNEKSLAPNRCPKLAAAVAAHKARPNGLTRGSKDADGNLEAWKE